jgi:hypothetical protein
VELACGPAVVDDKVVVACTRTGDVGIELVIAHGYNPTKNFHFQEHRGTWEKMIVAVAVLDVAMHYRPLVQLRVL